MKIGILGAGHMSTAMIAGWINAGIEPTNMQVYSPNTAHIVAEKYQIVVANSAKQLMANSDVIVLGFLPKHLVHYVDELKTLTNEQTVLSMLGSTSLSELASLNPAGKFWRILPNLPVAVNKGIVAYQTNQEQASILKLLQLLGVVQVVDEANFAVYSAIAGSGPAFVAKFMASLSMAGVLHGIDQKTMQVIVSQLVLGTVTLSQQSDFDALQHQVASPGGSTIKGLVSLEKHGFDYAVIEAINQTLKR